MARMELASLLSWPSLAGIPLLLLGNKNDLDHALTEDQLISQMQLARFEKRKIAVYSISAKKMVNIDVALKWLSELPKRKKQFRSLPFSYYFHSQQDTLISVSYTHLRAHETSLHLVCRLLLEKKKKKKQQHV
eukprot:TRINITY_DN5926_c0_g1_i1.p3 TRINITY_DN5926_c0_g1~~TRINITY_DN5926_c0_g1_i1.p3  ORF type:complete len:133 (+),score=12.38 TRINITY_DN5926_c0_g1_i1:386-784(+)